MKVVLDMSLVKSQVKMALISFSDEELENCYLKQNLDPINCWQKATGKRSSLLKQLGLEKLGATLVD